MAYPPPRSLPDLVLGSRTDEDDDSHFHDPLSVFGTNILKAYHDQVGDIEGHHVPWFPGGDTLIDIEAPIPHKKDGVIGIVGGGAGGLYAAMMLQSLGIKYEVLEASDKVGGRLFTYKFSDEPHDYYDVGAMRFPKNPVMKRTFKLFEMLEKESLLTLSKYKFSDPNTALFFNSIRKDNDGSKLYATQFGVDDPTLQKWLSHPIADLVMNVIETFVEKLNEDLKTHGTEGWKLMMDYDQHSMRSYMLLNSDQVVSDKLGLFPYPTAVINWMETFDRSDGWYDQALTETVLEYMAFATTDPTKDWFLVEGGSQEIAFAMKKYLEKRGGGEITMKFRVRSIALVGDEVKVETYNGPPKTYSHVITTPTMSCLRAIDLDGCKLSANQQAAIRTLEYGPSTKVGIKFKTQWWSDTKLMPFGAVQGGQSYTDRSIRTVVYPSYGIDVPPASNVLIVSYAWTNDALRLTGLMGEDQDTKTILLELILRDLAAVHNIDVNVLWSQVEDIYPFSWTKNPNTMGAFAFFGAGQFKTLYTYLNGSSAGGRLWFAGESMSPRHAWVVGALHASWTAVYQLLCASYPREVVDKFERLWGKDGDWSTKLALRHLMLSTGREFENHPIAF